MGFGIAPWTNHRYMEISSVILSSKPAVSGNYACRCAHRGLSDSEFLNPVTPHLVAASYPGRHGNLAFGAHRYLGFDDVFSPVPLGRRDISWQREVRKR